MAYIPAHKAVVMWALETGSINDPLDGATSTFATPSPTPTGILGYTDLPQGGRGLNNSKGFAIGVQGAAYNKRGSVQPSVEVNIRPGSLAALANLFPDANGELPYLTLFVMVLGQTPDIYRFCKPGSVAFNFGSGGGDAQGGEVTISVPFQALAHQRGASTTTALPDVRSLGTPLMWHDVRGFSIAPSPGGTAVSYRPSLMSLSATIEYNLERKGQRPNFGDNNPLSRTSYHLLEHHHNVSGEIGLHQRLPETLFTAAVRSQDWGSIGIVCSDSALGAGGTGGFTLTLERCSPSDETRSQAESGGEIDHTVPFTADRVLFALDEAEED